MRLLDRLAFEQVVVLREQMRKGRLLSSKSKTPVSFGAPLADRLPDGSFETRNQRNNVVMRATEKCPVDLRLSDTAAARSGYADSLSACPRKKN